MSCALSAERVWLDKAQYSDAERKFYESTAKNCSFVTEDTNKVDSVAPEGALGKSKRSKKARKEAKESTEVADQPLECPHAKGKKEKQPRVREEVSGALQECPVMAQVAEATETGKKKRSQKTKSVESSVEAPETAKKSKSKRRKEKKAQEEAEDTSEEMETTSEHSTNISPKNKTSVDTVSAPTVPQKARAAEKKHHKDAEGQKGAKEDEKVPQ